MLRVVLIFTHIPMYKYKLVDPTLCVKLFLRTHYAHICVYALLINEGPGQESGQTELWLQRLKLGHQENLKSSGDFGGRKKIKTVPLQNNSQTGL